MSQKSLLSAINDNPTDLDLRLDFADRLQSEGHLARAAWIRWSSRFCDEQFPLSQQQPLWNTRSSKDFPYAYSGNALVLKSLRAPMWEFFSQCRPNYWSRISGVRQDPYFGRVIFTVMSRPNRSMDEFDWITPTKRLGSANWLEEAQRDGWLEGIDLPLFDSVQARTLLEWPETSLSLPLFVSSADARAAGFNNSLMSEILGLPGLRGIQIGREETTFSCMQHFFELAGQVQHVSLLNLTGSKPSLRLLGQLPAMSNLRTLHLVGYTPTEHIEALATHPQLQTLILFSGNLTDSDLHVFKETKALRVLLIGDGEVTRRGVSSLRQANPRLHVVLGDDLRWQPL